MSRLAWVLGLVVLPLLGQSEKHLDLPIAPVMVRDAPAARDHPPSGKISAELLRYPLSAKALKMLRKALELSDAGDHSGAVQQLQKTLAKCPDSQPYVYSLIGVEYLKTDQIPQAVDALQQSVKLLPHDASNHANLGLAYFTEAQYDRAEPELRRALDLDPQYKLATQVLSVLASTNNTH